MSTHIRRPIEEQPAVIARAAGIFYLVTIITGVFAEVGVRAAVTVRSDAAATATNILSNENLYRLGLASDLIMLASYVAVTLLFYRLFKPVQRSLSLVAVFFSMTGIAINAVNSLNHVAPLALLKGASYLNAFERDQIEALALLSLRMHSLGYTIALVFFGFYCVLIGFLAYRSAFLPRTVGVLMALGGFSFLTSSFLVVLLPAVAARFPYIGMLGGIGELSLCLWLIVMGVQNDGATEAATARTQPA